MGHSTTDAEIEALRQAMKEHMEWEMQQWFKEIYDMEPIIIESKKG